MLHYVILRYMLLYVMLSHVTLRYIMLCYITLYVTLRYVKSCYVTLRCVMLCYLTHVCCSHMLSGQAKDAVTVQEKDMDNMEPESKRRKTDHGLSSFF